MWARRPSPERRTIPYRVGPRDEEATVKEERADGFPTWPVLDFGEAASLGASEVGAKAANLARLAGAGLPVPSGLVVTPAAEGDWEEARPRMLEAATDLGAERFAVR